MAPNGLKELRQNIPQTITDAMDMVLMIGERYLWVDSLCLIQDDENDMIPGIRTMDVIYEAVLLTIIAGSESDASSGLLGVHPESRHSTQIIETIKPGLKMTVLHELDDYMKHSRYGSRAWTYVSQHPLTDLNLLMYFSFQEWVLSRRSLVFINNQVYFRCRQSTFAEDTTAEYSVSKGKLP